MYSSKCGKLTVVRRLKSEAYAVYTKLAIFYKLPLGESSGIGFNCKLNIFCKIKMIFMLEI